MSPEYLSPVTIQRLRHAAIDGDLADFEVRDLLLIGIDRYFTSGLPRCKNPADQIQSDLHRMNHIPALRNGRIPMVEYLKNAIERTYHLPQVVKILEDALKEANESLYRSSPGDVLPDQMERIIHRDDMLPFAYAEGLLRAAWAVAHLKVPFYVGGRPQIGTSGLHVYGEGTGWLVTPELLVTAWHVVDTEPSVAVLDAPDLIAQVRASEARFNFIRSEDQGQPIPCSTLVAGDRDLDYAILRLSEKTKCRPLTLCFGPLRLPNPESEPIPVNIIQHPHGGPKMLGIRNNLVASHDDRTLRYYTDTAGGSSGSPVLDDQWRVIGVHTRWDSVNVHSFQGKPTAWVNCGTRIDRILEHLQQHAPAVLAEIESARETAYQAEST